jgi:Ras-related protein Rab-22
MDGSSQAAREVKVVLLGDAGVGKSSLVLRFVTNSFDKYSESTIGASFMSKLLLVDGAPIKYQIWDTAGQEKYHSLAPMYYRGAAAAIIVYDITRAASFQTLKNWVRELQQLGPENIVLAVCGNKSDLEEKREVSTAEAKAYAAEIGALFLESSAKLNKNVADVFTDISRRLPKPQEAFGGGGGAGGGGDVADLRKGGGGGEGGEGGKMGGCC